MPRYLRRLITIPGLVLAFVAVLLLLPIWLPLCALADVVLDSRRMRFTRLGLVVLGLVAHELATLTMLFVVWLRSGVGTRIFEPPGQRRLQWMMWFYGRGLVNTTERFLGVRLVVEGLESAEGDTPLLVFGHHTSLLDSAIPLELVGPLDYEVRYVIKKSLEWAPVFDVGGHLLPVHHVNRTGMRTGRELAAIAELAAGMRGRSAMVLFPEGSFHNPTLAAKALKRLSKDAPHLLERARQLRHTLPPRPGGALAMMDAAPAGTDVLFIASTGLEHFNSLRSIIANVPLPEPVRLHVWRVRSEDIPASPGDRYDWLFAQFELIDRFARRELDHEDLA